MVYTAQHYGKYRPRTTPKELEEQISRKNKRTREYLIDKTKSFLIKLLVGMIVLWAVAYLIVLLDRIEL